MGRSKIRKYGPSYKAFEAPQAHNPLIIRHKRLVLKVGMRIVKPCGMRMNEIAEFRNMNRRQFAKPRCETLRSEFLYDICKSSDSGKTEAL